MYDSGRSATAIAVSTLSSSSRSTAAATDKVNKSTKLTPSSSPLSAYNRSSAMQTRTVTVCAFMLLLCSTFLLQNATCMSLDRLGIDRNELLNEQADGISNNSNSNGSADILVDDMELKAVPAASAGGATDAYMLLPATLGASIDGAEQQAAVNQNVNDATKSTEELTEQNNNAMETNSDMLMMETNESPMMQVVNVPAEIVQEAEQAAAESEVIPKEDAKSEEVNEVAEMLPAPQALEGAPSLTEMNNVADADAAVDMAMVPQTAETAPELPAEINENSVEALPVPEALVGSPAADVTVDEVSEVNDVEQADETKTVEDIQQQGDEKAEELSSQTQVDEEEIPEEQKLEVEPAKSSELPETSAELSPELNKQSIENADVSVSDNADAISGENKIVDEVKPESESEPQQSIFGAFADAVEAVEEEIIAGATGDKLTGSSAETKDPELAPSDEKQDEANSPHITDEETHKVEESAEAEISEDSEVESAPQNIQDEPAEENPSDSKITTSAETDHDNEMEAEVSVDTQPQPNPELNEILPEKSETTQEDEATAALAESDTENVHENIEPLADSVAEDNVISEDVQEPEKNVPLSGSDETVIDEKPQDDVAQEAAASSELSANASSEKIANIETIKEDTEIETEKLEPPTENENKEEVKLEEDQEEIVKEEEKKDDQEQLHDSVEEEELVAEMPSDEEELNADEKQPELPAAEKLEENTANKVVEELVIQKDELPLDEDKDEIVPEKHVAEEDNAKEEEIKNTPDVEDTKSQEETADIEMQHNEQIAEEPEILEQTDISEEKNDSAALPEKLEAEQASSEMIPQMPENTGETKDEMIEKIDIPAEKTPELIPQIVEIPSEEEEKPSTDDNEQMEIEKHESEETPENTEEEYKEPQQTDVKQETIIFADVPEQQQLEEEAQHSEKEEIADTVSLNKDTMEAANMPNEKEEAIEVAAMESDTETDTLAAQSISSAEMQPQQEEQVSVDKMEVEEEENKENEAPEAAPMTEQPIAPLPIDTSSSMLTTIIQAPQPQQEDVAATGVDTKEPTTITTANIDNVVASAEITDAEAAAPQVPVVVINEENNNLQQATVATAAPPQPIEMAEVPQALPVITTQPAQQAPLNVVDSVLNYVNASFINQQQQQQQPQQQYDEGTKPQDEQQKLQPANAATEDAPEETFNSQLRRYDGAQVWRIVVQNDKDRRMADELQTKFGGQLWKEVKQEVDYLLKPQVLSDAARHIRAANLSRIVLIDNLQKVIEVENPPEDEILLLQNRKGHRLTWQAYHRLEDIHGFLDYMAKTYPDICSVETIGYSVEKRPLKILKISNGNANNPGIWIDGGMHAREWIGPATVTYIVNQLVEGWEDLPAYMKNINWYVHPMANPDGYEYSHTTDRLWRKNMRSHGRQCPGVDLNRNFGYKWGGKGTSANQCSQTYRGTKAFSEPETFYISKYISNAPRNTFQAYLTFHSYGQYILYPWGYDYGVSADKADLDRVARQAGTSITKSSGGKYTVGPAALTLYPAAGGADDWAKGIAGIKYTYTIEMGDTGRFGFVLPASYIEPNGKDGYTFVDTVARAITLGRSTERRRRF